MRTFLVTTIVFALVAICLPAAAELEQVEVGGSVRLRYNYLNNIYNTFVGAQPGLRVVYAGPAIGKRPVGGPFAPAVASIFDWDEAGSDQGFVEQRTRLHVNAQFTDDVRAFIEFDSYDVWGEDFRSQNYLTGLDTRANSGDDIEVFQGYIEANEMWGTPLRLRVGRQEIRLGSEFLVGARDFAFFFSGISFDAIRLTWMGDAYSVDVFASKLAERFGDFGDDDIDFYGVYASCTAVEDMTFDAYWLLVRDDTDIEDVPGGLLLDLWEGILGVDDYDTTNLHTVGLRWAGKYAGFDWDAEAAYQFGEADALGTTFKSGLYGDDDADFGNWGLKLDAGYAFDVKHHPHLFIGLRYYGGEDNRDITFWEWLNPFYKAEASTSFNRLSSNQIASGFTDLNNDLSNAWLARAGVEGAITEKLLARFCVTYFESLADFDRPVLPVLPFWTRTNDDEMGVDTYLFMEYHYSEDLIFEMGWAHLWTMDGYEQGNYNRWLGTIFDGGTDDDDADYVYGGCKVYF